MESVVVVVLKEEVEACIDCACLAFYFLNKGRYLKNDAGKYMDEEMLLFSDVSLSCAI